MKSKLGIGVCILALSVVLFGLAPDPAKAAPASQTIELQLTGAQEVPAHQTPMSVFARLTMEGLDLNYALTISGVDAGQVTAAHIHRGAPGVNGPVLYPLADSGFTTKSGKVTLTADDMQELLRGNLYVNVHSKTNPDGDVRAQIEPPRLAKLHRLQFDALAAGNVAGVMSYFAPNISFRIGGCATPCVGTAAVQKEITDEVGIHVNVTILAVSVSGNNLSSYVELRADAFAPAGIQRARYYVEDVFDGDKIVTAVGMADQNDAQTAQYVRFAVAAAAAAAIRPPATGDGGLIQ